MSYILGCKVSPVHAEIGKSQSRVMPTVQVAHAVDNASVMVAGLDERAAVFKRDPLKRDRVQDWADFKGS
jgi:hypothetical protein